MKHRLSQLPDVLIYDKEEKFHEFHFHISAVPPYLLEFL